MTRGEVWWGDIPRMGRRPVLVLTRDPAIPLLASLVVAIVTTQIRGIPTEVSLDRSDGMPEASVVSFDNLTTLSKRHFISKITELSNAKLDEVCEALRYATAC